MAKLHLINDGKTAVFSESGHSYGFKLRNRGRVSLTLKDSAGSILHADTINPGLSKARAGFVSTLNGLADTVNAELMALMDEFGQMEEAAEGADEDDAPRSQATKLTGQILETAVELFHDKNEVPYATVPVGDHLETLAIQAGAFKSWAAAEFYAAYGSIPGSQAVQDANNVIKGAAMKGEKRVVSIRIAQIDDEIYLDLGDPSRRAVKITAAGWEFIESKDLRNDVKFRRPKGMLALPDPVRGGSISELKDLMNIGDDDFKIVIAFMVAIFNHVGARPMLEVMGQQGTGKSTFCRMICMLIDPSGVPVRSAPREESDLIIAAMNRAFLVFDNLSEIPDWLSDAFCRVLTGGGISKRELYSDLDESLVDVQKAVVVNTITGASTRPDLLDRRVMISLEPINPEGRRTEVEIWAAFNEIYPRVLGAILDGVACALRRRNEVVLERLPRLADFALWVEAAAPAFGWESGEFLDILDFNLHSGNEIAIDASPVGPVMLLFMKDRDQWEGTATALLGQLTSLVDEGLQRDRDWPKKARSLTNALKRLTPNLRQVGVWVKPQDHTRHDQNRLIVITKNKEVFDRPFRPQRPKTGNEAPKPPPPDPTDETDDEMHGHSQDVETCLGCGQPLEPGEHYQCPACADDFRNGRAA